MSRDIERAAARTKDSSPLPLIEASQYLGVFEAEADGRQPALLVDSWNTIQFQLEVMDPDSGYDRGRSIYWAQRGGIYQFDLSIGFQNIDETAKEFVFRLATSNRIYRESFDSSSLLAKAPLRLTVVAYMDANDTAHYEAMQIAGTGKTIIKFGSYFRGRRLGDNR